MEKFPIPKGEPMFEVDSDRLNDRLNRARSYQERYPGTKNNDAVNAVLNTDYRGNLTESKKAERSAYSRAMKRLLNESVEA